MAYAPPPAVANDSRLNATNSVVDFGAIRTDGMVSVTKEGSIWVLRAYPLWRSVTVLLSNPKLPEPTSVQFCGDAGGTITPIAQADYWQIPLNGAQRYCWDAR